MNDQEMMDQKTYTCSMHPEVMQDHPGNCPECGMKLVLAGETVMEDETVYTCPMHPEVMQDHPGNCPECGMTLQPTGGAEIGDD